jgi:hypothetical protein
MSRATEPATARKVVEARVRSAWRATDGSSVRVAREASW